MSAMMTQIYIFQYEYHIFPVTDIIYSAYFAKGRDLNV